MGRVWTADRNGRTVAAFNAIEAVTLDVKERNFDLDQCACDRGRSIIDPTAEVRRQPIGPAARLFVAVMVAPASNNRIPSRAGMTEGHCNRNRIAMA
jgi:hypothetical protein